jgi:hypothetical protein
MYVEMAQCVKLASYIAGVHVRVYGSCSHEENKIIVWLKEVFYGAASCDLFPSEK